MIRKMILFYPIIVMDNREIFFVLLPKKTIWKYQLLFTKYL